MGLNFVLIVVLQICRAYGAEFCERPSGKSSRANFSESEDDSPSPWGEGRDEGGRSTNFCITDDRKAGMVP